MKLGIVIDSSAGLMKNEAEKRKYGFLPLYLNIDNKEYGDGIDITPEQYYSKININHEVKTSATPPTIIEDVLKKISQENDFVIVYPISKKLSSQTNNIQVIAKNFPNVYVVPSLGVGYAITRDVETLEEMAKNGASWLEIKETANKLTNSLYGFAAPATMKWLVKGGRITNAAAGMANLLKIVPLISFKNGGLDKFGKGRVFKKTIIKASNQLLKEVGKEAEYIIYDGGNLNIKEYKSDIEKVIGRKLQTYPFPPVIGNHIGPGVIALISRKK